MKKKILVTLAVVACALLLVAGSIVGTLAYLTSTKSVTNTFTVGKVEITMDETDVDDSTDGKDRDTENKYHLLPGQTYTKDPVIHVDANSENCFLFVKLTNELKAIVDSTTIEDQMTAKGWVLLDATNNVYYYNQIVGKSMNIPVFEYVKIKGSVTNTELEAYATKKVDVTAYAVQVAGFENDNFATAVGNAWEATFGASNNG